MTHDGSNQSGVSPCRYQRSRRRIAIAMLCAAQVLNPGPGTAVEGGPSSIPELQAAIEGVLKDTRTPGAAVVIVSQNNVEWLAGIGKQDVERNTPATVDTLFRIGSVSKAFAALAALQLQEKGKLRLNDTLRQWAPELPFNNPWEASHPVRLVHLMEHTTGFDDMRLHEYARNDPTPIPLKEALRDNLASRTCRWPPGTRMAYCNSGPAILAAVIEKVSGQRFEEYVKQHFFDPLQMNTASYFNTPEVQRQLTKLYRRDGVSPYPYWHFSFRPSGSVNASAKDMAGYLRFCLQRGSVDGAQLLHPSSIERMERMETLPSATLGHFAGYGLFNHPLFEGPFVFHGHGGAISGAMAEMAYLIEYGRGYAVMINSGSGQGLDRIASTIRRFLIRDLKPPSLPSVASVPAALRRHYAGYYQAISPQAQWLYGFERLIKVRHLCFRADGHLAATRGLHRARWVPLSDRLLRREDQSVATLALLPDVDGEVRIQSGWDTFKKVPAWRVWGQLIGLAIVSTLVLSSLLLAPVRALRRRLRMPTDLGPKSVWVIPLVSSILLIAFDSLLAAFLWGSITASYVDDFTLAVPNALTVTLMLVSIAFPATTLASIYVLYAARNARTTRFVYWHSVLLTGALGAVALYYGYWGLIGLRLW